jgi:hypothetical protein
MRPFDKSIGFRKNDNAFLAVDDPEALQAAADRFRPQIIRQRLDYWTLILGPKFSTRERKQMNLRRFYAVAQVEYCRNFIFKRHFPIRKVFGRGCEIGLWRLTAHKISEIFGVRLTKQLRGKLNTTLEQIEHGHHVFRAYWKNAFVKQYEKFSTFLRNEVCSNNLTDFRLRKGLDHLPAVRQAFLAITDRFQPLLAKHSKSLSLVDAIAVGVDRMQRNFEPMRKQVETWRQMELSNVTAKMVIYQAFIEGDPDVLRHLARRVHDCYFEPSHEEFKSRTLWSLSNAFTSAFKELDPIPQFRATARLGGFLEARAPYP